MSMNGRQRWGIALLILFVGMEIPALLTPRPPDPIPAVHFVSALAVVGCLGLAMAILVPRLRGGTRPRPLSWPRTRWWLHAFEGTLVAAALILAVVEIVRTGSVDMERARPLWMMACATGLAERMLLDAGSVRSPQPTAPRFVRLLAWVIVATSTASVLLKALLLPGPMREPWGWPRIAFVLWLIWEIATLVAATQLRYVQGML